MVRAMSHQPQKPLPHAAHATFEHKALQFRVVYGNADAAVRWALQEYADDPETFVEFMKVWAKGQSSMQRSVEFSEYRYWLTGVHNA